MKVVWCFKVCVTVAVAFAGTMVAVQSGAAEQAGGRFSDGCRLPEGRWQLSCLREAYGAAPVNWPRPTVDAGVAWQELAQVPVQAPEPADNPSTPEKVALGRKLFFDTRISRKGEAACATCHQPARSFTDGKALAVGDEAMQGRRRSQTLFGAPFAPRGLFWDGRAATLEQQVLMPIANTFELNHSLDQVTASLSRLPDYRPLYEAAFGKRSPQSSDVANALASFVRTIRPAPSRFDQFLQGQTTALTEQEILGLHLFRTKARCMNCHSGPLMTDFQFHDLGLSFYGRRNQDLGRFEVTRDKAHLGQFKTPSLRGISQAAPYMHNGIFPNLIGTIRMYNNAMGSVTGKPGDPYVPKKSSLIHKLNLTEDEMAALVAWLETL
ncbi:MAG: cytochrome-c peroxidase [Aquabacterium sp.]|uniref:cytochrome-c peroxidase n=1 Tax=Aquabacterium sp. TaxID=1872578 RepID=UPI003BCDE8FB